MGECRRALIVDDDPLFRSKVRSVLERTHDVVGETDDSGHALARVVGGEADLIVMDASRRPSAGSRMGTEQPLAVLLVAGSARGPLQEPPVGVRAYVRSAAELGELAELLFGLAATGPPLA